MNCRYVFDLEIEANPQLETITDHEGVTLPTRDFYGTLQVVCHRYPPHFKGLVRVQPDGWCGEWQPAYDFDDR
jgi:hypothetical protein